MRAARLAAALAVLGGGLSVGLPRAGATPADAAPANASVTLVSQTPWVDSKGVFELHVTLPGAAAGDRVQVIIFHRLITRTAFDQAAAGNVNDYAYYGPHVAPLAQLPSDGSGGYLIDLPVNQAPADGDPFPTFAPDYPQGVYPVQVALAGPSGAPDGPPLTTFLVFSQGTAKSQGFTPLSAAVIIPFASDPQVTASGQLAPPPPAEHARLAALAAVLNADTAVPLSVLASPVTIASLAGDSQTLTALSGVPDGGLVQILPTTWSPVAPGDLTRAGLGSEVDTQLAAAADTLRRAFKVAPSPATWVINGPLDAAGLAALRARGAQQIIVPPDDLTALSSEIVTTFTHATALGFAGSSLPVYTADAGLTADFTRPGSPVLAANILLAEMAMIFNEAPGGQYARGVVALPPPGWVADPQFVQTLLAGLQGDPLVSAVTASDLFTSAGTTLGTRYLAQPDPPPSIGQLALARARPDIEAAYTSLNALSALFPNHDVASSTLWEPVLLAESETLTPAQRAAVLAAVGRSTAQITKAVSLPPPTSITLTANQGQLPITILAAAGLRPQVKLVLRSQRLIFQPFQPPGGSCQVPTPTLEVCSLTLKTTNTTLKVPVQTRSSGVFPLEVELWAGSLMLQHDQDTVRSTAVSTAAIVLIVVALSGLAFWWVRDVRRGRRPRGMVAPPEAGWEVESGDPDVDAFFRDPPPAPAAGLVSPSATTRGPTPGVGPNGPETRR